MNRKKIIYGGILLVIVLLVIAYVGKQNGWIGQAAAEQVTFGEVTKTTIIETVTASGKVYPEKEVKISPDVSGEIILLNYEEGDSVQEGDLLLQINPDIYQAAVNRTEAALNQSKANMANSKARLTQAEAALENSKAEYERNKKLFEEKVISESEFQKAELSWRNAQGEMTAAEQSLEAARYNIKSAEATLKEARDNLTRTSIFAPMDGLISMLAVEKGERVVGTTQMAGTEMLRIADFSNLEVRVDVTENDILRVTKGDTARIDLDAYIDRKFKGVVSHIASSAKTDQAMSNEQVTNFEVKVKLLKNSYSDLMQAGKPFPFKPGMSATVNIETNKIADAMAVPIQSVTIQEEEDGRISEIVYVVENGKSKVVEVKTGIQDNRNIHIKSGLESGMKIITGPYQTLTRTLKGGE
ncbi:MAG: efflux RND transporter periplasmic adaptor subunit, partial [Chitinophagales bacterium]